MTPREPDRYDKAALEIWGGDFTPAGFAAALRRERDAALDEAAQAVGRHVGGVHRAEWYAEQIRALASPAAAPSEPAPPSEPAAPALRCPFDEQDCLDARVLLYECKTALMQEHGPKHHEPECYLCALCRKLAARTSPPGAGEGT